ncbi:MAG: 2OG-Fe(II) oxygenase [Myxococcota bacterium]|nr:2OG-Fe(II) oxygenase [Myxococcota bacterium]
MWTQKTDRFVHRVYNREVIGLVIRNAWTVTQCRSFLDACRVLPTQTLSTKPTPYLRSMLLAPTQRHPKGVPLKEYFQHAEQCNPTLQIAQGDLESLFGSCVETGAVSLLSNPRPHCIGSIRYFYPTESVPWHFDTYNPSPSFDHLHQYTDRRLQLSWYIPVQNPQQGGLLRVRSVHREQEQSHHFYTIELQIGDFVLFDASNYQHQITTVHGTQPRITFGGFAALDTKHKELLYWG